MLPTVSDVHVNTPLTNVSIAFLQNRSHFVASSVFPNVPVDKQSDRYYTYDRGDFNRDEMQERAPATESAGGGYRLDNTPTYYARPYAFHKDIPDDVRANADAVLNQDSEATEFVTTKALIKREKIFVANFFAGGIWTSDWDGVAAAPNGASTFLQWNDPNSTPIEDVRLASTTVLERTGFQPNKLVLGKRVFDKLIDHPDIVDRIKYGQTPGAPAIVNMQALAALFEVDEVLIMKAIENTALEGAANSHAFIGGKKALLAYAAPAPGLLTPSAGYTFSWTGRVGAGPEGNRIKSFRMEPIASDRVEIEMAFDQKLIAADLGAFFDTIVA